MNNLNSHVTNINRTLKNIKSDIMADFIHIKNRGVIITTNKIARALDLQTIKKYIKYTNDIEANQVEISRLSQSKSFLKIISIPYISETTHTLSRSKKVDLVFSSFSFLFYFPFNLFFIFLFLKTLELGLEVIGHTVTLVTSDGVVTTLIMGLERRE